MKILDRYILTTYLKTFISVFLILMLIFILQTIWLYIRELSGKDLDLLIVGKFLVYFMPKLIPLVLPLTILLASIMVFGNFAENYEFAAMKSTGISLQRAMSGLSIFIVGLAITTFFFSNNVIPWAELNSHNLRKNIAKLKPAAAIAEGQFNKIESTPYNIKVEKKYGENDKFLEDVTIHMKGSDGRKNTTIIKSETGELASSEDSDVLKLILYNGNYYSDVSSSKQKNKNKKPFAKSKFEKYIINIDLSKMNKVDIDEKTDTDKYNMLPISGLRKAIDSLEKKKQDNITSLSKIMMARASVVVKPKKKKHNSNETKVDSVYTGEILDIFNTRKKVEMVEAASRQVVTAKQILVSKKEPRKKATSWLNRHYISYNDKFALGFACVILFFVGAPLGALIRKGGIGLPMVIAILLFLTYHFIGIFAVNSAKNGSFNPILASWFSTLIMLPLSIFLTRRATADKRLFEFDGITEPFRKLFKFKDKNAVDYKFLNSQTEGELYNTIKNYESLGHTEDVRYEAVKILKSKGVSTKLLKEEVTIDDAYETSETIEKNYEAHTKYAIILYTVGIVLLVLFFIFRNNKLPHLASASIQLSIVSLVLFIIYYVLSSLNLNKFYSHIKQTEKRPNLFLLILGLPLYMIIYPLLRLKIKEDLRINCLESLK